MVRTASGSEAGTEGVDSDLGEGARRKEVIIMCGMRCFECNAATAVESVSREVIFVSERSLSHD